MPRQEKAFERPKLRQEYGNEKQQNGATSRGEKWVHRHHTVNHSVKNKQGDVLHFVTLQKEREKTRNTRTRCSKTCHQRDKSAPTYGVQIDALNTQDNSSTSSISLYSFNCWLRWQCLDKRGWHIHEKTVAVVDVRQGHAKHARILLFVWEEDSQSLLPQDSNKHDYWHSERLCQW